ncbi:MAG: hypothetical protein E6R00_07875 [Gammaproteobacteria bacterium]|nr:MAG: hypothetical protein E6R00_07875 [Gammaproteobacteria bacterium]
MQRAGLSGPIAPQKNAARLEQEQRRAAGPRPFRGQLFFGPPPVGQAIAGGDVARRMLEDSSARKAARTAFGALLDRLGHDLSQGTIAAAPRTPSHQL